MSMLGGGASPGRLEGPSEPDRLADQRPDGILLNACRHHRLNLAFHDFGQTVNRKRLVNAVQPFASAQAVGGLSRDGSRHHGANDGDGGNQPEGDGGAVVPPD